MKKSVFILFLVLGLAILPMAYAQQDPGARQDAEAAREKLLKAADQIDNIQSNSEITKAAVDNMKADVTRMQSTITDLQAQNASLKQQLADLQTAFDKAEAAHAKERQVLLDSVADMIRQQGGGSKSSSSGKKKSSSESTDKPSSGNTASGAGSSSGASGPSLVPPPDNPPTPSDTTASPPPKPQKGYYHVVESGETLRMICSAYRQNGVNVTVAEIQKANGLTDKSVLKVGQKIFIPKPAN